MSSVDSRQVLSVNSRAAPSRVAHFDSPDRIENYLQDEAASVRGRADRIWLPASEGQAAEVLAWADGARVPVTLSGGGTGLTGARVPAAGVVLATDRMRSIGAGGPGETVVISAPDREGDYTITLGEDEAGPWVRCACGIPLGLLQRSLAERGLWYPPDPTEPSAFVGGTLATNAAGARGLRYGRTAAWVLSLRAVLIGGQRLEARRGERVAVGGSLELPIEPRHKVPMPSYRMPDCKHAAGYPAGASLDLVDLLIGSEGTLALLTEVTLRLEPAPRSVLSVAFFLAGEDAALALVDAALDQKLAPLSLEYLDRGSLELIRMSGSGAAPAGAAAAVLVEVLVPDAGLERVAEPWIELAARHQEVETWAGDDSSVQARLKELRHALPEAVNRMQRGRGQAKVATDLAVPRTRFPILMEEYRRVMREFGGQSDERTGPPAVLFGHIGEQHLHLNFIPTDKREHDLARELSLEVARRAVELGGTISAEHGCGRKCFRDRSGRERPWLAMLRSDAELDQVARVKHGFDPRHLLGRDVLLPAAELDARIAPETV